MNWGPLCATWCESNVLGLEPLEINYSMVFGKQSLFCRLFKVPGNDLWEYINHWHSPHQGSTHMEGPAVGWVPGGSGLCLLIFGKPGPFWECGQNPDRSKQGSPRGPARAHAGLPVDPKPMNASSLTCLQFPLQGGCEALLQCSVSMPLMKLISLVLFATWSVGDQKSTFLKLNQAVSQLFLDREMGLDLPN